MKNNQLYHTCKAATFCIMLSAFYTMLVFFTGCVSVQDYMKTSDINDGQLTLFLKGHDKTFQDISFELAAVNIIAEDGTSRR